LGHGITPPLYLFISPLIGPNKSIKCFILNLQADDVQSRWCIAKPSAYNFELLRNIDYSCGQNGVDCGQIQPGGGCFRPDTAFGHASYAMNLFFKAAGKHPWDCHFNGTGIVVTQDPCKSPTEILVPGHFSNNDI
jgi:hypothetical protein